ncbi:uncharacterized protein [Rutidosis leptorrhynchoides]|uniref:uncharacterized protein n=1 Tax=Rutidosis leptorrhynchoides TaxID=125765 RepID=UPI003A991489
MALVIEEVISLNQTSFMKGGQILDGLLIISEAINRCYMDSCMLSSSHASPLLSGSPSSEFLIGCILRQGDPLSPSLFIIGMEGMQAAIQDATNESLYNGLHLLFMYADDVIFVGEWCDNNVDNLIIILSCFICNLGSKD